TQPLQKNPRIFPGTGAAQTKVTPVGVRRSGRKRQNRVSSREAGSQPDPKRNQSNWKVRLANSSGDSIVRLLRKVPPDEKRTPEQLRQHYEVEKEIGARLRQAPAEERLGLYPILYDELYRRVPLHPRLTRKADPLLAKGAVDDSMALLKHFLKPDSVYLEIGPGDCGLTLHVSRQVKQAYAVEVSTEATKHIQPPSNMKLIISDGKTIDVPPGTVTVAYSNQVMEHI